MSIIEPAIDLSRLQPYVARVPWRESRPDTLVVCCSDGRWHPQLEEFVRSEISDRPDIYAVPGGPAEFFWWSSSFDESRVAEISFRFLAEHHDLRSVWLIAHEGCAYYRVRCGGLAPNQLYQRQHEDLHRVGEMIEEWYPQLVVRKVYAWLDEDRVVFTTLPREFSA